MDPQIPIDHQQSLSVSDRRAVADRDTLLVDHHPLERTALRGCDETSGRFDRDTDPGTVLRVNLVEDFGVEPLGQTPAGD